jgi:hypothetical protein
VTEGISDCRSSITVDSHNATKAQCCHAFNSSGAFTESSLSLGRPSGFITRALRA